MDSVIQIATDVATPAAIGPTAKAERVLAPDLIRGVALSLIPLGNVAYYLWGQTVGYGSPPADTVLGRVADVLVQLFFGVGVPAFAIMVGWGLANTARRLSERGVARARIRATLVRRSLALLGLGFVHAAFLFGDEVLGLYGIAGLAALLYIQRSRRALVIWGTVGTMLAIGAYLLIGVSYATEDTHEVVAGSASYASSIGERLSWWTGNLVFLFISGLLCAPFVVGFMLSRAGALERPADHVRTLRRFAFAGLTGLVIGGLPAALVLGSVWAPPKSVVVVLAPIYGLSTLAGGVGVVCLFAVIAARVTRRPRRIPAAIAAVGERSLTFYLLQSLMLAPLLASWGFGLGGRITHLQAYGIAVAVALVNIAIAVLLVRSGVRGPMEALIRRLAYRRTATTSN